MNAAHVPEPRGPQEDAPVARPASALTDADRARAREEAAAMPPWTDAQVDEVARIADAAPAARPAARDRDARTG